MITREELRNIRISLPKGGYDMIAQEVGLSRESVYQILFKPERFNIEVIKSAIRLAEAYKKELQDIKTRSKSL